MNFKTGFFAVAVMGLLVGASGCGNACDDYTDAVVAKYSDCGVDTSDGSSSDGSTAECTDEAAALAECLTPCLDALTCDGLSGKDLDNATAYGECSTKCVSGG